jgi:hypothetical protein
MKIDVEKLDRMMAHCQKESKRLRGMLKPGMKWAEDNAALLDEMHEVFRQVRQDQQMTSMSGKRLESLPQAVEEVVTDMEAAVKDDEYFEYPGRDLRQFVEWIRKL